MPANYEKLADTKTWVNGVYVLIGLAAPEFMLRLIEGETDTDLPDEVYGVVVAALALTFTSGNMRNYVVSGAVVHVALKFLERMDVIQPVHIAPKG